MSTDIEWEKWGATDPYFGVITLPQFRAANLTEDDKREFFASGRHHVEVILKTCRHYFDSSFSPRRVLDFGCGVGRLVIPFADLADWIVGVDVSPSMLTEARKNCIERGLHHIDLVISDDSLSSLDEPFDLVHSSIVFQHIDVLRGRKLFSRLVQLIKPGGLGAIHITYGKAYYAGSFGNPPTPSETNTTVVRSNNLAWLKRYRKDITPTTPKSGDPEMQMNAYSLSEIGFILQQAGIMRFFAEFTDHGGELGVILYFQRPLTQRFHE